MPNPTHLHFDPYSGISGDMSLGALVDLGVSVDDLQSALASLPIGPLALRAERVKRAGIMGTRVHVEVNEDEKPHRHLRHVLEIIEGSTLPPRAIARAADAYRRLAEAEAEVHGSTPEKIHFHEVGAKDAIVDIAGAMLGVELLGAASFSAAPLVVGFGTVACQHGTMPVPAPATALLMRGMPQRPGPFEGEFVTPTGAAILATLLAEPTSLGFLTTSEFDLAPDRIGYGAGGREIPGAANYLRLALCAPPQSAASTFATDTVATLACELDDMSPEAAAPLLDRLLAAGALDAHFAPVQMKKGRPGFALRVLCRPADESLLAEIIFAESTTFGLRRGTAGRFVLDRRTESVDTPYGPIAVKLGLAGDRLLKARPEFESVRAAAATAGVPFARVFEAALAEALRRFPLGNAS